ncbi:IPT/TIG domain-containing protein [Psychroserpens damuponensis]|uniref:IPT/TIG domain-containing protein n=1 Tax=Psychroserpens damuponensis TaxID=943936 RepID=UPI00069356E7|nr:IPT/TIG domain-containing protein [Psychroserpens damuponensis]
MKTKIKSITILLTALLIISCSKDDNIPDATLVSISPTSGPKTTVVTISGTNFGTDPSVVQVFFNDKEAVVQSVTNTEIIAKVPARAYTGAVKIIANNTELIGPEFTYTITETWVDTFAGSTVGNSEGNLDNALFNYPNGVVFDSQGNLFVADTGNHSIRKITPDGIVSTFAGSTQGFADATGTNAMFNFPNLITIDSQDNLFIADTFNHKIRKITPNGEVSTFAGSTEGNVDATGVNAKFNFPRGITIDSENNLYVSDTGNHTIRKITPTREVTTLAGSILGFQDGAGATAKFSTPYGLVIDKENNILVADFFNNRIRKISSTGMVSTFTGSSVGYQNGPLASAKFKRPIDITIDANDNIYIVDSNNYVIRKISNNGLVSTIAGNVTQGVEDGAGSEASFISPYGITIGPDYKLYTTDAGSNRIRTIIQE